MRKLAAVLALIASVSAMTPCLGEDYAPLPIPLKIEKIPGKPIYYSIGNSGIPGQGNEGNTSNAGFVVTYEGVVVFDALGTPSLGWALLQEIRKVTDKPIRYVIASHYHADHIYGLQAFKDHSAAMIIAQDHAAEYKESNLTADEQADQRLDQRRSALAPWVNDQTRVVPPDITFAQHLVVTLGGKRFNMIYAGPAHSSSDIMMMVEPDGVLFAGDVVQNSRVPFMNSDDVDTKNWLHSLDLVAQMKPNFIIPGHGKTSDSAGAAITFTKDYIDYVRAAMQTAVENWTDFDVAYKQTDWSKYKNFPAFSSNNRGNAYRIYLELEQSQFNDAAQQ